MFAALPTPPWLVQLAMDRHLWDTERKQHPCSYHCSFQVFVSDKNQHGCGRVWGILLEECGNLESRFKICTVLIQSFWIWKVLSGSIDSVLQQGGAGYMWQCKVQTFHSLLGTLKEMWRSSFIIYRFFSTNNRKQAKLSLLFTKERDS